MKNILDTLSYNKKIKSIIVFKGDKLLVEDYYNGSSRNRREPINSITKSIVSILIGIAIEKNLIDSENTELGKYFDVLKLGTIKEHLNMISGINWGEDMLKEPYTTDMIRSESWIDYILSRGILDKNIGKFKYSGASSHLIGNLISKLSEKTLFDYAKEEFFTPLGIEVLDKLEYIEYSLSNASWCSNKQWDEDPDGNNIGSFGLRLRSIDLLEIGKLILNNGKINNTQIIDKCYLENSFKEEVKVNYYGYYGYHWWIKKIKGVKVISALGISNQYLTIIPEYKSTIVILSRNDGKNTIDIDKIHRDIIINLIEN